MASADSSITPRNSALTPNTNILLPTLTMKDVFPNTPSKVLYGLTFESERKIFRIGLGQDAREALCLRSDFWRALFDKMDRGKTRKIRIDGVEYLAVYETIFIRGHDDPDAVPFEFTIMKEGETAVVEAKEIDQGHEPTTAVDEVKKAESKKTTQTQEFNISLYVQHVKLMKALAEEKEKLTSSVRDAFVKRLQKIEGITAEEEKAFIDKQLENFFNSHDKFLSKLLQTEKEHYATFLELIQLEQLFHQQVNALSMYTCFRDEFLYHDNKLRELILMSTGQKASGWRTQQEIDEKSNQLWKWLERCVCPTSKEFLQLQELHRKITDRLLLLGGERLSSLRSLYSDFCNLLTRECSDPVEINAMMARYHRFYSLRLLVSAHAIKKLTLPLLALGIKFDDGELLELPIDWDCPLIRENFQRITKTIGGVAEQYIQFVIDRRRGPERRNLHGKTLLMAVLNNPQLSELWDNSDLKYREKILHMVNYPTKGFGPRAKETSEDTRKRLRQEKVADIYSEEFYRIITSKYPLLQKFLDKYKMLPSDYIDRIPRAYTMLGGFYLHQDELTSVEGLISLENQAYRDSTRSVDKKTIKAPASEGMDLVKIKALCAPKK